jgi:hypothetical protein
MILYSKFFNFFIAKGFYLLFLHGKNALSSGKDVWNFMTPYVQKLHLFLRYYPY